jgi:hypothetical protein
MVITVMVPLLPELGAAEAEPAAEPAGAAVPLSPPEPPHPARHPTVMAPASAIAKNLLFCFIFVSSCHVYFFRLYSYFRKNHIPESHISGGKAEIGCTFFQKAIQSDRPDAIFCFGLSICSAQTLSSYSRPSNTESFEKFCPSVLCNSHRPRPVTVASYKQESYQRNSFENFNQKPAAFISAIRSS